MSLTQKLGKLAFFGQALIIGVAVRREQGAVARKQEKKLDIIR